MSEIIGNWLHFSGGQRKRKRAELVCVACHSKKVKCDLQVRLPGLHPPSLRSGPASEPRY